MLQPKEDIFDRIEQSFLFMKKNFIKLILPLFIYNFLFFGVIYLFFINYVSGIIGGLSDFNGGTFLEIIYSAEGILVIAIVMFLLLLNAFLYIPMFIASIRSIHQAAMDEKINMQENVIYGFKNILNSFRTYWYIFKYIYLIPAVIFIVGGILFNIGYIFNIENELLQTISVGLMIFSFILFLIFSIYRGLKTSFVLYSAISNESFTQNDFDISLKTTNNNLWRILGNFLLIGFIISFFSSIISNIVNIFLPNSVSIDGLDNMLGDTDMLSDMNGNNGLDNLDLQSFNLSDLDITFSNISYIISSLGNQLLSTIFIVFGFVFTYIFMKRLELENKERTSSEIINETEKSEIEVNNVENKIKL